ncbi:hypothetical protein NDU88_006578 [Pleurodeles waltl]|uniref:Uncharacterized protein n=1 Tax=Pleurodeles waltl TaxID=8319 RepID=A0AAV7VQ03_PLEWA|nr:hypothetical protein NDU88_006578 [Pleurodeles waltl]
MSHQYLGNDRRRSQVERVGRARKGCELRNNLSTGLKVLEIQLFSDLTTGYQFLQNIHIWKKEVNPTRRQSVSLVDFRGSHDEHEGWEDE